LTESVITVFNEIAVVIRLDAAPDDPVLYKAAETLFAEVITLILAEDLN
jgi:hypothetical protein